MSILVFWCLGFIQNDLSLSLKSQVSTQVSSLMLTSHDWRVDDSPCSLLSLLRVWDRLRFWSFDSRGICFDSIFIHSIRFLFVRWFGDSVVRFDFYLCEGSISIPFNLSIWHLYLHNSSLYAQCTQSTLHLVFCNCLLHNLYIPYLVLLFSARFYIAISNTVLLL